MGLVVVVLTLGIITSDRLQHLVRSNADALANSIVLEQGKTLGGKSASIPCVASSSESHVYSDAHGDVLRGLQVIETACGITSTLLGEKIEGLKSLNVPVDVTYMSIPSSEQGHGY